MNALAATSRAIDWINEHVGRVAWWLAVGIVGVQFAVVLLRYIFGSSSIMMQESIIYMHAALFMLGAGYTLLYDGHVRVDIFYGEAKPRTKAWVDLIGVVIAVAPFCLLLLWVCWPFVAVSWRVLEGPMFVGGFKAVYLLKTLIPVFAVLLLLQGLSIALRAILVIAGRENAVFARKADPGAAEGAG